MAVSFFAEKDKPPALSELFSVIGEKRFLWESLNGFISDNYNIAGELKFYDKSYGWMVWFRKAGKTLVALYLQANVFIAQIVLGPSLVDKVPELFIGENVRISFEKANQYPDGRWLYIKVISGKDVEDIEKLLLLKQPLPKRRLQALQEKK
jgi:Protein of unknown function (DUF3788)